MTPRKIAGRLLDGTCDPVVDLVGMPREFHPPDAWDTGRRSLECDLVYCVATGSIRAEIGGESMVVPAGSLIWIGGGRTFRLSRENARRLTIYRFRLHLFQGKGSGRRRLGLARPFLFCEGLGEETEWCQRIVHEAAAPGRESGMMIRGMLACLMVQVSRAGDARGATGLNESQRRAIGEATARCAGWPGLGDLASAAGLSPDYFSRLFRRSYGMNVREWIVRERIRAGSVLLAESAAGVGEIARQLGYEDLFYFCRQFKQVSGVTPTAFRKRMNQV